MDTPGFAHWVRHFTAEAERRQAAADPEWTRRPRLPQSVWSSLQRFQVGENGDGANLISKAKAAGDLHYADAVGLFIAEEQNHARLLAMLLASGGIPTIESHWSDRIFVRTRRLFGLRLELMVLTIAELIAVPYYRSLRDGTPDPFVTEIAARILADEQRHIPFHCDRLRESFASLPRRLRALTMVGWRLLLLGAAMFVALDHGPALNELGVGRARFVAQVLAQARPVALAVTCPPHHDHQRAMAARPDGMDQARWDETQLARAEGQVLGAKPEFEASVNHQQGLSRGVALR